MTPESPRKRVLDPLERFSEIVFGLIMVLSFTCALSITHIAQEDVRRMLVGAILCNLAWGIIDAAFYLISCLAEYSHNVTLLLHARQSTDAAHAQQKIIEVLPPRIAEALLPADFERIHEHLKQTPIPTERMRLSGDNWRGAVGVFLLVFLSTFPVVVPFIFISSARLALHVSNLIAIVLLFGSGHMLAGYAGLSRLWTGVAMVAIGAVLVAITIALGG